MVIHQKFTGVIKPWKAQPMTTEESRRLHKRLDEQAETLGKIAGDVKAIKAACEPCCQRIDRLSSVVGGNGTEGLVSRVASIEGSRQASSKLASIATTAAAATLAATVAGLIVAFFAS